jgi:hypothetical protein
MSDIDQGLRKQVKQAIGRRVPRAELAGKTLDLVAEDVLAVAEPAIRADERDRLAQKAGESVVVHYDDPHPTIPEYMYRGGEEPLADWIRAQDDPDDKKIYIGFRQKKRERKAIFSEGIEIEIFDRANGPYRVTDIATGAPIAGVTDWQLVEGSDVVLDHIGETDLAIKHHQLVQLTIDSMGVVCTITMPAGVKRP